MVKRAEQIGDQGNNTACSSHASIPTTLPFNNNITTSTRSPLNGKKGGSYTDTTETFSAKRKRLQSHINAESNLCKVYDVPVNTSLPPRGLNTSEGYDPLRATKQRKDNKSPNKQKRTTSPTHCSGGPSVAPSSNNIFNYLNAHNNSPISILPSSNSELSLIPEEPGAFSSFPNGHNDTTNLLHNRGGSRYLSQADHVGTDVSSDVGSHVNRDWLTRRFHPPGQN